MDESIVAENISNYVENFMYLFSRETELEKLMEALCGSFGIEWEKGQSRLQLQNNAIIMQVDVLLENMGEEYKDFVKEQRAQVS